MNEKELEEDVAKKMEMLFKKAWAENTFEGFLVPTIDKRIRDIVGFSLEITPEKVEKIATILSEKGRKKNG